MHRILTTVFLCSGLSSAASAQSWSFTRIADTSTPVPGVGSPFQQFGIPSIGSGSVVFLGRRFSPAPLAGMYLGNGGALTVVADHTTPIPSGTGSFTGFGFVEGFWPSSHSGATAFVGDGAGKVFLQRGIYLRDGSGLTKVVDRNTAIPNGFGVNFFIIREPSLESGRVAFVGGVSPSGGAGGVYSWQSGVLSVVADHTTQIPGGPGTFERIFDCDIDQGTIVFSGDHKFGHGGIYRADAGGTLSRLYDTTMAVPGGGGGNFTFLGQAVQSDGHVAFYGQGGGQEGIYADVSGTLQVVANRSTPMPGLPGLFFGGFNRVSINGSIVAFSAIDNSGGISGVFSTHTGALGKVLATGDTLDGRIVAATGIGGQALDGNSIALGVIFTDGSRGIYMATIPAPASVVLLLGMAMLRRRRLATARA